MKPKRISVHSKNKKLICLALQGGGAYGAFTWGILDRILEDERLEIDAISATSAGSINAVVMADGICQGGNEQARINLNNFWIALSQYGAAFSPLRQNPWEAFFGTNFTEQISFFIFEAISRVFSPYVLNPFNFNPLRLLLLQKINFSKLQEESKIKLFLCATNIKTGRLKIFENSELTPDTVLASACLPNLYQAVKVDKNYYWDGGFVGNPAIFPLIYNSQVEDIIILHTNPIDRMNIPISAQDMANRINEISFNSSLLRELRAIAFVTKLIDDGCIKTEYQYKISKKFTHLIRSDEMMKTFTLLNKYNWHWDFLFHLHKLGRISAESWLNKHFRDIGKRSTIDFNEFLS